MTQPIKTWKELQEKYSQFADDPERWVFRGHREASWKLVSTLERALQRYSRRVPEMEEFEDRLLREFQRNFHRYSDYRPSLDDRVEWLSLMQHHGAPTRLLDWTYSFYVALFFAVEGACVNEAKNCAIWALDVNYFADMVIKNLPKKRQGQWIKNDKSPEFLNWITTQFRRSMIYPLNCFHLNARLSVQQGVFLASLDVNTPFQAVFDGNHAQHIARYEKIEINCSSSLLETIITELRRMNVTRLSLYGGVDGLAQGLWQNIPLKKLSPFATEESRRSHLKKLRSK